MWPCPQIVTLARTLFAVRSCLADLARLYATLPLAGQCRDAWGLHPVPMPYHLQLKLQGRPAARVTMISNSSKLVYAVQDEECPGGPQ